MPTTLLPKDADIIKNIARYIFAYFTQSETTDNAIMHLLKILNSFNDEYTTGVFASFNEAWWPRHVKKISDAIVSLDKIKLTPDKIVAAQEAIKVLVFFLQQSISKNWQPDSLNYRLIAELLNNQIPDFRQALTVGGEHLCWQLEIALQQQTLAPASVVAAPPILVMHGLWQLVTHRMPFLDIYTKQTSDRSGPRVGKV